MKRELLPTSALAARHEGFSVLLLARDSHDARYSWVMYLRGQEDPVSGSRSELRRGVEVLREAQ